MLSLQSLLTVIAISAVALVGSAVEPTATAEPIPGSGSNKNVCIELVTETIDGEVVVIDHYTIDCPAADHPYANQPYVPRTD
ncbi:MAG: hypothetical protein KY455_14155 [Euryarchaeota archaeon]|nr:hypothetical protein [Euryarchaeota archaeon]